MTAKEIREQLKTFNEDIASGKPSANTAVWLVCFVGELAAQLAELNQVASCYKVNLTMNVGDDPQKLAQSIDMLMGRPPLNSDDSCHS